MADAIVQALDQPFEEALRFFRQKASVTTRTWTDVYAAAHSHAFMVAGAATDAIVADFRAEIEKGGSLSAPKAKPIEGAVPAGPAAAVKH